MEPFDRPQIIKVPSFEMDKQSIFASKSSDFPFKDDSSSNTITVLSIAIAMRLLANVARNFGSIL